VGIIAMVEPTTEGFGEICCMGLGAKPDTEDDAWTARRVLERCRLDVMVIEPGPDLCHPFGMIVPNPPNLYRVGHG